MEKIKTCAHCGKTQAELDEQNVETSKGEKAHIAYYDPKDDTIPETWEPDYYCSKCAEESFDSLWGASDTYWEDEE